MAPPRHAKPRPWRDRRGIAATEMALVAPFLLFFMVVGVDFGRATSQSIELTHAVRAGAQHSLTALGSKSVIEATIKESLPDRLKNTASITATCYCGAVPAGNTGLPPAAECSAPCPATSAKMMTLRAAHAFTPYNIVFGHGMATAFGFNQVVSNVTIRHW
jgi:hypothetical protein